MTREGFFAGKEHIGDHYVDLVGEHYMEIVGDHYMEDTDIQVNEQMVNEQMVSGVMVTEVPTYIQKPANQNTAKCIINYIHSVLHIVLA